MALKRVACCDKLNQCLSEEVVLCLSNRNLELDGFRVRPVSTPAVYLISDGGHGGVERANFCPFCGVAIAFDEET